MAGTLSHDFGFPNASTTSIVLILITPDEEMPGCKTSIFHSNQLLANVILEKFAIWPKQFTMETRTLARKAFPLPNSGPKETNRRGLPSTSAEGAPKPSK